MASDLSVAGSDLGLKVGDLLNAKFISFSLKISVDRQVFGASGNKAGGT